MPKIEIKNVYKIFGRNPAVALAMLNAGATKDEVLAREGSIVGLADVSLAIEAGEIFVIMGLSGSGKSTLIRHINRLVEATSGSIFVDGEDVVALSTAELRNYRRRKVSMVFQSFGLMPHQTVIQNVAYGLALRGTPRRERQEIAARWMETVGLVGYENKYPSALSGGMRQRVGLARALAADTDVILMDEPFSALDPIIRAEMQDQLLVLQRDLKKTIVFVTHDLDEAVRVGSRIAILNAGQVAQVGTPHDIFASPADAYVERFVQRYLDRGALLQAQPLEASKERQHTGSLRSVR